jgi:hypothetical protein
MFFLKRVAHIIGKKEIMFLDTICLLFFFFFLMWMSGLTCMHHDQSHGSLNILQAHEADKIPPE